jgi:hypothetical protein
MTAARTVDGKDSKASRIAKIKASLIALRFVGRVKRTIAISWCSPVISKLKFEVVGVEVMSFAKLM